MNEGRLLQAVLSLVEKYERDTISNINFNEEVNIDVLQLSNLHKMETVLSAVSIGSNVDFLYNEKEAKLKAQEVVKEPKIVEKNFYEECVFEINPDAAARSIGGEVQSANQYVSSKLKDSFYGKSYKATGKFFNKATDEYNDFFKDIFEEKDYDIEGCLNCRKPMLPDMAFPPFEISWEIKKFLDSLRSLLNDLKLSLDSTQQVADLCNFLKLSKEGYLCISNYSLILAAFPIIINDIKTRLFEVSFSWTGLAGPLIMPVLKALVKAVEMLRGMTLPLFDCLLNGLKTTKAGVEAIGRAASSIKNQSALVIKTFDPDTYRESIENRFVVKQNLNYRSQSAVNKEVEKPATVSVELNPKVPMTTFGIRFEDAPLFKLNGETVSAPAYRTSLFSSTGLRNEQNKDLLVNNRLTNILDACITRLTAARVSVDEFFNNITYALRAFQRTVIEPMHVSAKLMAELRVVANLARFINLIYKIISLNVNLCDDFDNSAQNSLLKSLVEAGYEDVELDFVKDENGDNFALVKSKSSDYKSRLRPNSCGEITIDIDSNQNSLDLIYDHLANSLGTK